MQKGRAEYAERTCRNTLLNKNEKNLILFNRECIGKVKRADIRLKMSAFLSCPFKFRKTDSHLYLPCRNKI